MRLTSAAERWPSHCPLQTGPFYQWRSAFLPTCHFLMALGVIFLFLSPPQSDASPCSEPWALLLGRVLKESFSYWAQSVPLWPCCDCRERRFLLAVSCEPGPVASPTARPTRPDCGPEGCAPSFLPGPACCFLIFTPARTQLPSPARLFCSLLVAVSCGAFFAEEKALGK